MKVSSSQSGRSMVEIIGVLAVIGVLSIGSIAGYSYGMDKYRASETVNDIMLRSIDLIKHISAGKKPDVSEWKTEKTIYPIVVLRNDSLGQYAIVAENIPSRVCKMIGDTLKEHADIYVGSDALEDETDDTDPCEASEQNTMEFYFDAISCDPACGEDEYCENGWCFKATGTPRTWNSKCGIEGASCTTEDGENGFCEMDICIPLGSCTSNDECGAKEYCAVVNYTSSTERFPTGTTGTCVKVNFLRYEVAGTTYYVSATDMNWWNAEWACAKIGKEHLDNNDLTFTKDGAWHSTNLSLKLYEVLGDKYVWTKTPLSKTTMWTPRLKNNSGNFDAKQNNHDRIAVCK